MIISILQTLKPMLIALIMGFLSALFTFLVSHFFERESSARMWWQNFRTAILVFLVTSPFFYMLNAVNRIEKLIQKMERTSKATVIGQLNGLKEELDPDFRLIFEEHFNTLVTGLCEAIEKKTITITDIDQYRFIYKRILSAYPGITFYATSFPSQSYFWNPNKVEENSVEAATLKFIRNGGRLERIFLIEEETIQQGSETDRVMHVHANMGVDVSYIPQARISGPYLKFFLVASNGKVAVEATLGGGNKMSRLTLTVNNEAVKEYLRIFRYLKENAARRKYNNS